MRAAALRLCEDVHTEVEFEWLRPWAAQGGAHAASHALYWRPRMARLLRAWDRLEARTAAHPNPNPIPYPNPNPNPNPSPKPNPSPNQEAALEHDMPHFAVHAHDEAARPRWP